MIQMELSGLGFDPRNMSPIVLLKDSEERNFLPIWIGMFEAGAIAMALQDFKSPRPMTHDLIANVFEQMQAVIEKVVIVDHKEDTFYAVLEIRPKGAKDVLKIDCRSSDAIAIAVRTGSPIFVLENVMLNAKMVNSEKDKEETAKFQEFINNVNPDDFKKYFNKQ
ncbi:bifunctional nuclease superfamily [Candidatus Termititenax aidoneus]|uniref:Bifunctional nuclease superfamily n=1 Tax=Termititenax aidoneus TaxID=2218524 RepID=A0A388TD33_TERA1|nr:bifunctional nuclease superfamily [Candidatus Termititenax aidoneus]